MVRDALIAAHGVTVEIVIIKTTGDIVQDRPLAEIGARRSGPRSSIARS
jgi:hydroxymethylbilane synthase